MQKNAFPLSHYFTLKPAQDDIYKQNYNIVCSLNCRIDISTRVVLYIVHAKDVLMNSLLDKVPYIF